MHVILRPQKWLLFLLFFSTGLCSASCLDCGAAEFESVGVLGDSEYRFSEKDYCIAERIAPLGFDDFYEVFFSDDMKSYKKERCQYSTIESLRRIMPESVVSPEAAQQLLFWYPNNALKSFSQEKPSHRACLTQKVLVRKEDARKFVKSKPQPLPNLGTYCNACSESNSINYFDSVFPSPTIKPYLDDFNKDSQIGFDYILCYAPYIELSYELTTKQLNKDLKAIERENRFPGLCGATNGTVYAPESLPEITYENRSLSDYLIGFDLDSIKETAGPNEHKYRAIVSRAREIDKQLSSLSESQRTLLSRLYAAASEYAPNVVVKEVCLGKSAYFKKDWDNAWKHYEEASSVVRNNAMMAREIALDYHLARRKAESCIWLTRHIDVEPNKALRAESKQLISDIEYSCKKEYEKKKDSRIFYWNKDRFPLKVYFPRDFVLCNGVSYREEFDHAMFNWMHAARGKMSFVYVHKKKDADIVVDFSYHRRKYRGKYSKERIPIVDTQPEAFASTNVHSTKAKNSLLCPIKDAEIHFFYDSYHYDAGKTREACMHEIGHALGLLNHSKDSKALMYHYMSSSKESRTITKDEIERLSKLYKKHPIKKDAYKEYVIGLKAKGLRFKPQLVSMGSRPD